MSMSLITSDKSKDEYITSAVDFKPRFRIHKGEIKTKTNLCGTSRHVNEKHQKHQNSFWICQSTNFWTFYGSEEPSKTEEVLWYGERYWQSQLLPIRLTVSMIFTSKSVTDIESNSLF